MNHNRRSKGDTTQIRKVACNRKSNANEAFGEQRGNDRVTDETPRNTPMTARCAAAASGKILCLSSTVNERRCSYSSVPLYCVTYPVSARQVLFDCLVIGCSAYNLDTKHSANSCLGPSGTEGV